MRYSLFLISIVFLLSSCSWFGGERVNGNGSITTKDMNLSGFNNIEASGSITVRVRQDAGNGVKIETDENLFEFLDVFVENNTLVVRTKKGYNLKPSKEVIIHASAPTFQNIDVSGSVDIIGENTISGSELNLSVSGSGDIVMEVNSPKVTAEISGSGSIALRGTATVFNAGISGSGEINCFDLNTEVTSLDLSGAADAEVTANQKLDVKVSGSGSVQYKGAATVSQNISGSGSVKKVG